VTIQRTSRRLALAGDGIIDLPVVEIAAAMRSCLRLTPEQETE
jgi:hypothetical protein